MDSCSMFIKNVNRKLRNNLIQGVPYHFRSFLALNQGWRTIIRKLKKLMNKKNYKANIKFSFRT